MKKQISLLTLCSGLFLFTACGPQGPSVHLNSAVDANNLSSSTSIVGGQVVDKEIFAKHVVAIYNQKSGFLCSGTLISKNVILTAAHCTNVDRAQDYYIFFGKALRSGKDTVVRQVSDLRTYAYQADRFYDRGDLGLIRFVGDLPPGYEPMPLPTEADINSMGRDLYTAGYGTITARKDVDDQQSGVLRYTQVKMYEGKMTPGLNQFTVDQSNGHGICHGDSGGPAFIKLNGKRILIGVASAVYTNDKTKKNRPGFDICKENAIYIATYYYLPWIRESLKYMSL